MVDSVFTDMDALTIAYLASPHSHPDPTIRDHRYSKTMWALAKLIEQQHQVYSPIVHCHPMAIVHNLNQLDYHYWQAFDEGMIRRLDEFWILVIDGWRESVGMRSEYQYARSLGKPIRHVFIDTNITGALIGVSVSPRLGIKADYEWTEGQGLSVRRDRDGKESLRG